MTRNVFVIKEFDEFGGVEIYPMVFLSFQSALEEAEQIAYDKFYSKYKAMHEVYVIREEDQIIVERIDRKPYQIIRRFDIDNWTLFE